jgi:hypothetical protein
MALKPRDFDAELQALTEKAKKLRSQKTMQLGELVQLVEADTLSLDALAGVLLAAVEAGKSSDGAAKIARWSERGQALFQQRQSQSKSAKRGGKSVSAAKLESTEPGSRAQ